MYDNKPGLKVTPMKKTKVIEPNPNKITIRDWLKAPAGTQYYAGMWFREYEGKLQYWSGTDYYGWQDAIGKTVDSIKSDPDYQVSPDFNELLILIDKSMVHDCVNYSADTQKAVFALRDNIKERIGNAN